MLLSLYYLLFIVLYTQCLLLLFVCLWSNKRYKKNDYDHVGINISIFLNDVRVISKRISKDKIIINVLTGLGIHKCGLTMVTCNILLWSVVIPVALYGCNIWRLNEESVLLM